MLILKKGDLLNNNDNLTVICHQVNCQGAMGAGIALAIKNKYPKIYERYLQLCNFSDPIELLGNTQEVFIDKNFRVINMFSQLKYGKDGKRYTSYDAFYDCLKQIKKMTTEKDVIGFPCYIGCVRGGASWNIILEMIKEILYDRDVIIYELEVK